MIINQQTLQGIFTGFKTIFNKVLEEKTCLWDKVATKVSSETGEENYKWLGKIPRMREWIGAREIQNLSAYDYTIKNKDYELTVGVDRNDIEDDKLGIYAPSVTTMAESAKTHPDELVFKLMNSGFTTECYDKKPFYSDEHPVGKKKVSNMGKKKLSLEAYAEARAAMMSYTDEHGKSLRIVPDLLVVPPSLEAIARKILFAEMIDGSTNIYKDTAELLVVPDLAQKPTQWHLLDTKRALKPFIFQERKPPKLVALISETDQNVFFQKQYLYGVDGRCNVGFGFWQMAFGSTGEE